LNCTNPQCRDIIYNI